MNTVITVLMYHALAAEDGSCAGADAHYAIPAGRFRRQVESLRDEGLLPGNVLSLRRAGPSALGCPAFTFDDGHASNALAAEILAECGGSADFFVNPSTVGRAHNLSWDALRQMAAAGMSIQSHGQTHRYLDDLPPDEVRAELRDSKREIEDRLGRSVDVFAPPGGRMGPGFAAVAREAGYSTVCSSRVGLWSVEKSSVEVPRLAVLHSTSDAQWQRWVTQDKREMARCVLRHQVLTTGKRLLGNRRYDKLRQGLLGSNA
jgi:peptidoglycan/xylan/chitin deacetylase (PgdA/CDA1 family)